MSNCTNQNQEEQLKEMLLNQYDYLSDDEVNMLYNLAFSDYVAIKYPFQGGNRPEITDIVLDFADTQWVYKRMLDILGRAGGISLTAYRENNLNLTYGASYIDPELYSLLTPNAGVPR